MGGALVLGCLLSFSRVCSADETRCLSITQLEYERSPGAEVCPDERAVLRAFGELGRRRPAGPGSCNLHVMVAVRQSVPSDVRQSVPSDVRQSVPSDVRQSVPSEVRQSVPRIRGRVVLNREQGEVVWTNEMDVPAGECSTLIASLALSLRIAQGLERSPDTHEVEGLSAGKEASRPDGEPSTEGGATPEESVVIRGEKLPPKSGVGQSAHPSPEEKGSSPAARVPSAARRFPDHHFQVAVAVVTGAATRGAPRLSLGYTVEWTWGSMGFEVRGIPPVSGDFSAQRVNVARWESAVVPCLSKGVFFVCGLLSAGAFRVEVDGVSPQTRSAFRAGAGARAGAELQLSSRFSVAAHLDIEGTFWPAVIQLSKRVSWKEAAGQIALGFSVIGTVPGARW